jgi:AraC-like DNA-binding protein
MRYLDGDYEILIGIVGTFYLQIGEHSVSIGPGDICIVPPYLSYEGTKPSETEVGFYWLHFFPRKKPLSCSDQDFIKEASPGGTTGYVYLPSFFHTNTMERFHILMRPLLDLSHSTYYTTTAADYQTTLLTMELTDQYLHDCLARQKTVSDSSRRFSEILEWVRIHINEEITVQTLSDHFVINPDYLTRLFKRQFGMSCSQYITRQRMDTVKSLIISRNLSIKEIAYLMHFHDEKYLMRLFKKNEGITISQYRNAYTNTYLNNSFFDPDFPRPAELTTQQLS